MKKVEGVILDWAGTTVDFGCFAPVQAFFKAFTEYRLCPTLEEVRKPMGMLKRDHVKTMLAMPRLNELFQKQYGREWEEQDVDNIYKKSEKDILDIVHDFARPKPYVLETMDQLRNKGLMIGSTTGYTDQMMRIVTKKAKEAGYEPDTWYSPDSVNGMGRPYPYMIFENMKELGLTDVKRVLKVGDTVSDIREGIQAGVITVGVVDGSSVMGVSEEEFECLSLEEYKEAYKRTENIYREAGADYVIPHMGRLPALIEELEINS